MWTLNVWFRDPYCNPGLSANCRNQWVIAHFVTLWKNRTDRTVKISRLSLGRWILRYPLWIPCSPRTHHGNLGLWNFSVLKTIGFFVILWCPNDCNTLLEEVFITKGCLQFYNFCNWWLWTLRGFTRRKGERKQLNSRVFIFLKIRI